MPRNKSERTPKPPKHWDPLVADFATRMATEAASNNMSPDRMRESGTWGEFTPNANYHYCQDGQLELRRCWRTPSTSSWRERREYMADLMEFLYAQKQDRKATP